MDPLNKTDFTIAAPWAWEPSTYWDGNDGSWNSFIVQVGTPPQAFRVLPSTAGQETWVLNPDGCTANDPSDCPSSRGALNGSRGFQTNESSTWSVQGIYDLNAQEQTLGYTGNGLYGFDTLTLGSNTSSVLNLAQQVVAGIADKSYYLGQFGVGPKPINFTTFNNPIPNCLSNLVSGGKIPSLSFGYTAGAAYQNKAPASLTLGGYDTSRFKPTSVNFSMNSDNSRPLQVGVSKILGSNTLQGTITLMTTPTYHFIDSTIPHIWLPSDVAQAFVAAFGLTYDNNTDLFLINDTMRNKNLQNNAAVTFVLSPTPKDGSGQTQNIVLPYAAFDQQASYPFYENATNYFPMRIAHNSSQYTLGRTFFQEAYVIADWERQNFTVAQTSFDVFSNPQLVPIISVEQTAALNHTSSNSTTGQSSYSLRAGAIAGIAVSAVAAVALIIMAILFLLRHRRRQRKLAIDRASAELHNKEQLTPTDSEMACLDGDGVNELPSASSRLPAEVDGISAKWARSGIYEVPGAPARYELGKGDAMPGVVSEAVGDEPARVEMPANGHLYDLAKTGNPQWSSDLQNAQHGKS